MENREISNLYKDFHDGNFQSIQNKLNTIRITEIPEDGRLRIAELQMAIFKFRNQNLLGLEFIKVYREHFELTEFDRLYLLFYEGQYHLGRTNESKTLEILDRGNTILNQLSSSHEMFAELNFLFRLLKASYHLEIHDINLAKNYILESSHLMSENFKIHYISWMYQTWSNIFFESSELDKVEEICYNHIQFAKSTGKQFPLFYAYTHLAYKYIEQARFEEAKKYLKIAAEIEDDTGSLDMRFRLNNLNANLIQYEGNLEQTIELHKKNKEVADQIGSKSLLAMLYNNLATCYNMLGEVDLSQEYNFLSLDLSEELGNKRSIGTSYNNIAINFLLKGELDRSLNFLMKYRNIVNEIGPEKSKAVAYVNLGQLYHMKGDYSNAIKYYNKGLEIDTLYGSEIDISESLYSLLVIYVEIGDLDKAEEYKEQIKSVHDRFDNKLVTLRYKLAKMQLLKASKRTINKAKAQEILLEIVNDDIIDFELYVSALLNLCELLLLELRQSGEEEVLDEIKDYVDTLHEVASVQQSHMLLAESYLIKSKLAHLEMNPTDAKHYIEKAEALALEKNLDNLAMKISSYHDDLLDQIKTMENLFDRKTTLKERLEKVQLEELFEKMIDTKTDELNTEPETPTMFLIIKEGGNNLYKRVFQQDSPINEELISGLFSALHTLSAAVFHTEASQQRIKHKDYTIILSPIEQEFLFAYVFTGNSYTAIKKMNMIVESIRDSSTIWEALCRDVSYLTNAEKEGMDIILDAILRS